MMAAAVLAAAVALAPCTPPPCRKQDASGMTPRRDFLGGAFLSALVATPLAASAAVDCLQDCLQNCARLAGGSKAYCKESCIEYCAQTDRKDGLSGSVSSEGAEFGWASSFKNPFDKEQKGVVYGTDKPPGLPDVFGVNKALRNAVTGGDLSRGGVQGQGGARDYSDQAPDGGLFSDPTRYKSK
jgi:hypothetical protein